MGPVTASPWYRRCSIFQPVTARVIPFPFAQSPDDEPDGTSRDPGREQPAPGSAGPRAGTESAAGDGGWEAHPLHGARIMVVEHDQETRETLVWTLENWGAVVVPCGSVADAAAALDDVVPDAVLVAIRMPGDPYRFIAAMRRRDGLRRRHTPMLAIVGGALDRRRAASSGIHLHVPRPLDPARLRMALANLVRAAA